MTGVKLTILQAYGYVRDPVRCHWVHHRNSEKRLSEEFVYDSRVDDLIGMLKALR